VDAEKVALLFGDVPSWADPDDPEDRAALLTSDDDLLDDDSPPTVFRAMVYETIATQIADEDPPEVWATARRLTALGLDREAVLRNASLALIPAIQAALDKEEPFDPAPLSSGTELGRNVYSTFVDIVSGQSTTLTLSLTGKIPLLSGGWYELDLPHQPGTNPDQVTVSVSVAGGWRVTGVRGGSQVGPSSVTAGFSQSAGRSLWVQVAPAGS
jgi:hypothetical protein